MPFLKKTMDNDKLLLSKIRDISKLSEKYNQARFSDFLDEAEKAKIQSENLALGGVWFGGYEGSARQMLGFFPKWCELSKDEFPISAVKITNKGTRHLSHRDYLGTIMSLGLQRRKIGDIAVGDSFAYVFLNKGAAELVASIEKIANSGVKCEIVPLSECIIPSPEYKLLNIVAASMRLDAVVGAVCNLSRKNASALILSAKCDVNHITVLRTDYTVKSGDTLSIRGFGRFLVEEINGETRSGRLHIIIKKFI